MSASDAAPLPRLGEVFFDVRGSSRSMRLSWYADTGVAVFSIWQGGMCTGTFRLAIGDLPRMVETLQRGPGGAADYGSGATGYLPGAAEYGTGMSQYPAEPPDRWDGPAGYPGGPGTVPGGASYPDRPGDTYRDTRAVGRGSRGRTSPGRYPGDVADDPYLGTGPMDFPAGPPAPHYPSGTSRPGHDDAPGRSAADYPAHYGIPLTDDIAQSPPPESFPYGPPPGGRGPAGRHAGREAPFD